MKTYNLDYNVKLGDIVIKDGVSHVAVQGEGARSDCDECSLSDFCHSINIICSNRDIKFKKVEE